MQAWNIEIIYRYAQQYDYQSCNRYKPPPIELLDVKILIHFIYTFPLTAFLTHRRGWRRRNTCRQVHDTTNRCRDFIEPHGRPLLCGRPGHRQAREPTESSSKGKYASGLDRIAKASPTNTLQDTADKLEPQSNRPENTADTNRSQSRCCDLRLRDYCTPDGKPYSKSNDSRSPRGDSIISNINQYIYL